MNRVDHLLWIVGEECAEIAQRASKAARFGLTEVQPDQPLNNGERIIQEYADLIGAIEMLVDGGHIRLPNMRPMIDAKKAKVEKYLLYAKECGTLEDLADPLCANCKDVEKVHGLDNGYYCKEFIPIINGFCYRCNQHGLTREGGCMLCGEPSL